MDDDQAYEESYEGFEEEDSEAAPRSTAGRPHAHTVTHTHIRAEATAASPSSRPHPASSSSSSPLESPPRPSSAIMHIRQDRDTSASGAKGTNPFASRGEEEEDELTLEQMKQHIRESLRKSGAVNALTARLRSQLISHLSQQHGLRDENGMDVGKPPPSFEDCVLNSLIVEHLKQRSMLQTVSVFLPESQMTHKVFSKKDIAKAMQLVEGTGLYRRLLDAPEGTVLERLLGEFWGTYRAAAVTTATQTESSDVMDHRFTLDLQLRQAENRYLQGTEGAEDTHQKTMEEKMLAFQRECEDRVRREVQSEVQRFRESELAQMRLEEAGKHRRELDAAREEIRRDFNQRLERLKAQYQEEERRMAARVQAAESAQYEARQKLLREMEILKEREADAGRVAEAQLRSFKLEELRAKEMKADAEARMREAERQEAQLAVRIQAELERARVEGGRAYAVQIESIKREREFLESEMEKVRAERDACKTQLAEVSGLRKDTQVLRVQLMESEQREKTTSDHCSKLTAQIELYKGCFGEIASPAPGGSIQVDRTCQSKAALLQELDMLQKQRTEALTLLAQAQAHERSLEAELTQVQAAVKKQKGRWDTEAAKWRKREAELIAREVRAEEQLKALKHQYAMLEIEADRLRRKAEEERIEQEALREEARELRALLAKSRRALDSLSDITNVMSTRNTRTHIGRGGLGISTAWAASEPLTGDAGARGIYPPYTFTGVPQPWERHPDYSYSHPTRRHKTRSHRHRRDESERDTHDTDTHSTHTEGSDASVSERERGGERKVRSRKKRGRSTERHRRDKTTSGSGGGGGGGTGAHGERGREGDTHIDTRTPMQTSVQEDPLLALQLRRLQEAREELSRPLTVPPPPAPWHAHTTQPRAHTHDDAIPLNRTDADHWASRSAPEAFAAEAAVLEMTTTAASLQVHPQTPSQDAMSEEALEAEALKIQEEWDEQHRRQQEALQRERERQRQQADQRETQRQAEAAQREEQERFRKERLDEERQAMERKREEAKKEESLRLQRLREEQDEERRRLAEEQERRKQQEDVESLRSLEEEKDRRRQEEEEAQRQMEAEEQRRLQEDEEERQRTLERQQEAERERRLHEEAEERRRQLQQQQEAERRKRLQEEEEKRQCMLELEQEAARQRRLQQDEEERTRKLEQEQEAERRRRLQQDEGERAWKLEQEQEADRRRRLQQDEEERVWKLEQEQAERRRRLQEDEEGPGGLDDLSHYPDVEVDEVQAFDDEDEDEEEGGQGGHDLSTHSHDPSETGYDHAEEEAEAGQSGGSPSPHSDDARAGEAREDEAQTEVDEETRRKEEDRAYIEMYRQRVIQQREESRQRAEEERLRMEAAEAERRRQERRAIGGDDEETSRTSGTEHEEEEAEESGMVFEESEELQIETAGGLEDSEDDAGWF